MKILTAIREAADERAAKKYGSSKALQRFSRKEFKAGAKWAARYIAQAIGTISEKKV